MLTQWAMSAPHPLCGWKHPGELFQAKCISHHKPASCILDGFWLWQQTPHICGGSFILGFTFANNAVFLNLTLVRGPNKYSSCFFPLSVSFWVHENRGMPVCCPAPFPRVLSLWHCSPTTDQVSFSVPCYHDMCLLHAGCFLVLFILTCKGSSWKRHFFSEWGNHQYCTIYLHFQQVLTR